MTPQEKNKAIAEWLGIELNKYGCPKKFYISDIEQFYNKFEPDKDRNQQKLIEDKLVEMGYWIDYSYNPETKMHQSTFYTGFESDDEIIAINSDKDIAFIDAVIELIESK